MRVNSRMRARASRVSTSAAILAAFALGAVSLTGCGQKGPLYMPTVPPLPQKPNFETQPAVQPDDQARAASDALVGTIPDTSGTPLSLSPDPELNSAPASASAAQPASAAAPAQ
ncbi:putative lipoprotein [Paraburkholderia eburnea]|uniref:Putative lipoprotein n=2 Tax=Paraburkholderia eburnea TaxID=1189126 RepID=A0A2S4LXS3_9BURK|nr:lipoprotein [Paraburkholderia eburnea]POR47261.1 putative lipoprotein [Paraburkholderia eburnea]PRZ18638.1 putative lipoprotein [Paraburkholderia eburnea]